MRPGAMRLPVEVSDNKGRPITDGATQPKGLMCSAYRNVDGSLVIVVINYADEALPFHFEADRREVYRRWHLYRTSEAESENLSPIGDTGGRQLRVSLSPRSITTFVCTL